MTPHEYDKRARFNGWRLVRKVEVEAEARRYFEKLARFAAWRATASSARSALRMRTTSSR